jgi:glucose/arabinose dehydrogenase
MRYFPFIALLLAGCPLLAQGVDDPSLKVQKWATGLSLPTGIQFLPDGRALILEKETGQVKIMSGRTIAGTALDLPVATDSERGLLGIALSPNFASDNFVYLYYTAAAKDGGAPISNSVKRYTWNGSTLAFNKKIIDLPATPGPNHDSGQIAFGPDGKLYIAIGDLNRNEETSNHNNHTLSDIGAILRVNPSGSPVTTNPFYSASNTGAKKPLNFIFGYGIRNSFGMDFDPISKSLWETENGPESFDEINRITPGFNGGWESILGPLSRNGKDPRTLVSLGPAAHYSDPKFSWASPVAPTAAFFMPTARLGAKYRDDLFVSTYKDGRILDFNLSPSRKTLALTGPLADGVADNTSDIAAEQGQLDFGSGFGSITDLTDGPGGMYVLAYDSGTVYRITTATGTSAVMGTMVPEPATGAMAFFSLAACGECFCARALQNTRRKRRR